MNIKHNKICFGVDFGGVIVKHNHIPNEDTNLTGSEKEESAQPGVFDAISEIASICDGHVYIVSKAGQRMQARTLAWIEAVDFFSRTGLEVDHIRFCLERQEKENICRELEISHFIDDRIHIMQILHNTVPYLYLFGEEGKKKSCPPWATYVSGWAELLSLFKASLK